MSSRPTAAIITPYGLFNYGNRLQNWAVDHLLEQHGFRSKTLVLRSDYTKGSLKDAARFIGHSLKLRGEASDRYRNFHEFDRDISKQRVVTKSHLRRLGKKFDAFVIGSDQIWNPHQVKLQGAEFANMSPSERIMSLSASIGVDALPDEVKEEFASAIRRIPHVSVREFSGARIIEDLTGRAVPTLVDPTLAITSDVWSKRADSRMVPAGDYVVFYLLGTYTQEQRRMIEDLPLAQQGRIVPLFDKSNAEYYSAGPQDFLGLIRGAKAVITDSFHAVVFSLQFGVPCTVVSRQGLRYSMGSRFDSLQKKLSLQMSPEPDIDFARRVYVSDSQQLSSALAIERDSIHDFLSRSLEDILSKK